MPQQNNDENKTIESTNQKTTTTTDDDGVLNIITERNDVSNLTTEDGTKINLEERFISEVKVGPIDEDCKISTEMVLKLVEDVKKLTHHGLSLVDLNDLKEKAELANAKSGNFQLQFSDQFSALDNYYDEAIKMKTMLETIVSSISITNNIETKVMVSLITEKVEKYRELVNQISKLEANIYVSLKQDYCIDENLGLVLDNLNTVMDNLNRYFEEFDTSSVNVDENGRIKDPVLIDMKSRIAKDIDLMSEKVHVLNSLTRGVGFGKQVAVLNIDSLDIDSVKDSEDYGIKALISLKNKYETLKGGCSSGIDRLKKLNEKFSNSVVKDNGHVVSTITNSPN